MINFRFNLEKTYKNIEYAKKAKELQLLNKKIPQSYFYDKETAIYLSTSYLKKYIKVNTGLRVLPKDFDINKQEIKLRNTKSLQFQHLLNKIKDKCISDFRDSLISYEKLNFQEVKDIMQNALGKSEESIDVKGFFHIYDKFLSHKKTTVKKKTIQRYMTLRKILFDFEMKSGRSLSVDDLNARFASDLVVYLNENFNYAHNTVVKLLKLLKCFAKHCFDYDYSKNVKYNQIKATEDPSSIFVLSLEEIESIKELSLDNLSTKEVRDVFCFLCYTGQRYSDVKQFCWKDIVNDGKHTFWRLYQYKTKSTQFIDIPLLPEALKLIEERSGNHSESSTVFRVISNQKMNAKLKDISAMAKIRGSFTVIRKYGNDRVETVVERASMVSSHAGRKSFITNALKRGMPITLVQKISGHSSIKAMKPYIELSGNDVAEALYACFSSEKDN
jgi:integrase